MGHSQWIDQQVSSDFSKARLRAMLNHIARRLRQEPQTLLPFEEVRSRINIRGQFDRGIQTVPLDAIVGSEGRYSDFDRTFLPLHEATRSRWENVSRAHYGDVHLPPVELFQIGDVYFVRDGNHRVSVARLQDQSFIDAHVIELISDIALSPSLTAADLASVEERSDFLEWTQLGELRPEQQIEVSQPGGYLDIIRHINGHRYFKSLELNYELSRDEAVLSWFDTIYTPLTEAIERTGILAAFPERTPADLYLWIMDYRHYLTEAAGVDPGAEEAAIGYAQRFGERKYTPARQEPIPAEEAEFLAWAGLVAYDPLARVPLAKPADYERLRTHVLDHQFYLGQDLGREVAFEEAARSWYETVYGPIVAAAASQQALAQFPQLLLGDLYLLVSDYLHYRRDAGVQIDPEEAMRDYAARFGRARASMLTGVLHQARRLMRLALIGS